jgi:hypothetical protein
MNSNYSCGNCAFYHSETKHCRRYPIPETRPPNYWCGEHSQYKIETDIEAYTIAFRRYMDTPFTLGKELTHGGKI